MKNIHVLPTDKPSRLIKLSNGELRYNENSEVHSFLPQNIYITSNEEIKRYGEYYLDIDTKEIKTSFENIGKYLSNEKKIILTTDQDLIKDGVQAIDDEFLEWFVKNPSCESVEVKDIYFHGRGHYDDNQLSEQEKVLYFSMKKYKIIIPKEEFKQDKIMERFIANAKQETLEEASKSYSKKHQDVSSDLGKYLVSAVFQDGAKWQQENSNINALDFEIDALKKEIKLLKHQQERSYSEEEVIELLQKALTHQDDGETGSLVTAQGKIRPANFFSWFERFKNK